ncbi:MAG TPA: tRNA lysidine(34) synthetase TilS [Solirubrobacterales bacterium]|nr:tRNA lysidine(34) synthetase TilS [Solirubrobacterales bacterium]
MSKDPIERVTAAIHGCEHLGPPARVLALLSGGADSVCLLHSLARALGPERVAALHVNHGLRARAEEDEEFCRELCQALAVRLHVERVDVERTGNLEARAREARYAAAEAVRAREGFDLVATGHTGTDQVETVLYRLASSPGRRALLGMAPLRERIVRPLLELSAEDTRDYCRAAGLAWREDESNQDRSLARNRLRLDVVPALREIHHGVERNVIATAAQLRDEQEVVERAIDEALTRIGAGGYPPVVEAARLAGEPPAMRRLVLQRLAESAAGGPVSLGPERMGEIERLAARGGSGVAELGGGVRAVAEYGFVRFTREHEAAPPAPAVLPVPGSCRFGEWELECVPAPPPRDAAQASLDEPVLDAGRLAGQLAVRAWQEGDRMRPLGLGGTKSLQDVFTDRKVPRGLRRSLPVVVSGEDIAWVAGVAVSDLFKLDEDTAATVRLRARAVPSTD